jgi:glycosyltransferase involved in cell wall biosynthesis
MKVSIIIPSSLEPRKHQASNPEDKLIRAVNSALNQDYEDIEVIVVADGCIKTLELLGITELNEHPKFKDIYIDKQPAFSGNVRNTGIEAATGDIICYLDADDYLGTDHISTIVKNFTGDWVWFNDMVYRNDQFEERQCSLKFGYCGTSNIAHLRSMKARWNELNTYARDDWEFIQNLQKESPYGAKIETPTYIVCHIPFRKGYDL